MRTLIGCVLCFGTLLLGRAGELTIVKESDAVVVKNERGRTVLQYQLQRPRDSKLTVDSACYFHPVTTPSGMTMTEVAPSDHPHHRGIFFGWVEMHGAKDADFWGWGEHAPKKDRVVVNREVTGTKALRDLAAFRVRNEWLAEGTVVMEERLDASMREQLGAYVIDLSYMLTPAADTKLARWAFSGFCVRTRKDGKLEAFGPDGPVAFKNPKHTEPETDWPNAAWYGYTLTFEDGKSAAVAVINHPDNPPALWHNHRDVRMLNPCIVAPASVEMKAGQSMILRYRVVVHDGPLSRDFISKLKFM